MQKDLKIRISIDKETGQLKVVEGELNKVSSSANSASKNTKSFGDSLGDLAKGVAGIYAVNAAFHAVVDTTKDIAETGMKIESMTMALEAAVGSSKKAQKELEFLSKTSKELGLSFEASIDGFTQFAAAAKQTSLEGEGVRKIFKGVSEASAVMGLSVDDQNGVFRALSQMMSKGKIQAEELRGQLGERLPGAFQIASRSMGMTTSELDKFMSSGKLLSDDFLPKFGKQLEKEFGEKAVKASKTARAEQNRYNNSLLDMKVAINDSGLNDLTKDFYKLSSSVTQMTTENIPEIKSFVSEIGLIGASLIGAKVAMSSYSTVATIAASANIVLGGTYGAVNRSIILATASTRALSLATKAIPYVAVASGIYTMINAISSAHSDMTIAEQDMNNYADSIKYATTATLDFQLVKLRKQQSDLNSQMNYEAKNSYNYQANPHYRALGEEATQLSDKIALLIDKKKELLKVNRKLSSETKNEKSIADANKRAEALKKIDADTNADYIKNLLAWEAEDKRSSEEQLQREEKAHDLYTSIMGTGYDKWLQSASNNMRQLAASGAYSSQELQNVWDTLNHEYEMKIKFTGMDEALAGMNSLKDAQIEALQSSLNLGAGFDGVAKNIANVSKVITQSAITELQYTKKRDILNEKYKKDVLKSNFDILHSKRGSEKYDKAIADRSKIYHKHEADSSKLKQSNTSAEMAGYSALAGSMASMYEQGSAGAIAFTALQSALGIASSWTAIAEAWAEPGTLSMKIASAAIVTAGVMPIIAQLGGSGGGGMAASQTVGDMSGSKELTGVFGGSNKNTSLEDALSSLESSIRVQNKLYESSGDFGKTYKNELKTSMGHFIVDSFKDNKFFKNTNKASNYGRDLSYDVASNTVTQSDSNMVWNAQRTGLVAENATIVTQYKSTLAMIGALTDINKNFSMTFGDNVTNDSFKREISSSEEQIKKALDTYTTSLLNLTTDMVGYRKDWISAYEGMTGDTKYTEAKVKKAMSDVGELQSSLGASSISDLYSKLIDGYNLDLEEMKKKYNTMSKSDFTQYLIDTLPSDSLDPEKVYKYIDALSTVGDAMGKSASNIKDWQDSFKSQSELTSDMASKLGVGVATSNSGLTALFNNLKGGVGGLTDEEKKLLDANKKYVKSINDEIDAKQKAAITAQNTALQSKLNTTTSIITTFTSSLTALTSIMNKLNGVTGSSTYSLDNFRELMSKTQKLSGEGDAKAYQKSLSKTITAASALFKTSNFSTSRDQKFTQAVAERQFEALDTKTVTQIDVLKEIAENTRSQIEYSKSLLDNSDLHLVYSGLNLTELETKLSEQTGKDLNSLTIAELEKKLSEQTGIDLNSLTLAELEKKLNEQTSVGLNNLTLAELEKKLTEQTGIDLNGKTLAELETKLSEQTGIDLSGKTLTELEKKLNENTYLSNLKVVDNAYKTVLGRDADTQGAATWAKQLTTGGTTAATINTDLATAAINYTGGPTDEVSQAAIETSQSNAATYLANTHNADVVAAIYTNLGYDQYQTDNSGRDYWAGQLASGAITSDNIESSIHTAGESWKAANGYKKGGFTGNIGVDEIAGPVHGQEYVIDAPTTKDLGLNGSSGIFTQILDENRKQSSMIANQNTMIAGQNSMIELQANEIRTMRKEIQDQSDSLDEIARKVA